MCPCVCVYGLCERGRQQKALLHIYGNHIHSKNKTNSTYLKHKQTSNINTIYLALLYRSTDRCQYLYLWGERGRESERERERERDEHLAVREKQKTDQQFRTVG